MTARLSKLFYDRLGEEIANELVEWFNQVDATYRTDLREVNDVNFARFEAKLDQRIAELETRVERRIAALEAKVEQRLSTIEGIVGRLGPELTVKLERGLREQTRWMFVVWSALLIPIIGLWFR